MPWLPSWTIGRFWRPARLSSDPERSRASAPAYGIPPERAYGSYQEMTEAEAKLSESERLDFVTIATPNYTHFAIARALVEAGFNVVCDKPMTFDLAQAEELAGLVARTGVVFGVTHGYTGYPLVRQARDMIRQGELGEIQAVRATYLQGSLRRPRTPERLRRLAWKLDPARAGASGCFGDIGIHAYNLIRFATDLRPKQVSCQLCLFEPGAQLDDYGVATVQFANGGLGTVTASRISHGKENDLRLEIDGTLGSLEWRQEEPNQMWFRVGGQPHRLYTRDPSALHLSAVSRASCRIPAGHPEGYLEAFANIYTAVFADLIARATGQAWDSRQSLYPNVLDGLDGMNFIAQCVASSREQGTWKSLEHPLET